MTEVLDDKWDIKAKKELSVEAYKHWELIWDNSHLIKSRDYWMVIDFVETFEEYRFIKKKLKVSARSKTDPRVHENSNGTVQTGPYKAQLKDIQIELRHLARELALSPTSAAALRILNDNERNTILDLLKPVDRGV